MTSTAHRGKLILFTLVALLVAERLAMTGYVLVQYFGNDKVVVKDGGKPKEEVTLNWTSIVLPLTHIIVLAFLLYTSDMLIYWLVILWGVITSWNFAYKLWVLYEALIPSEKALFFSKWLPSPGWWPITFEVLFHLLITLCFLFPAVRVYLKQQRSKLDFIDLPPAPAAPTAEKPSL